MTYVGEWIHPPVSLACLDKVPAPRCGHTLSLVGSDKSPGLVVSLGQTSLRKGREFFGDLNYFNLTTLEWSPIKFADKRVDFVERADHSCEVFSSRSSTTRDVLVFFGGRVRESFLSDTFVVKDFLDPKKPARSVAIWDAKGPRARRGHTLTCIGEQRFLLFGGHQGPHMYDDTYLLDLNASQKWTKLRVSSKSERVVGGRAFHSAVWDQVHQSLVVMGGVVDTSANACAPDMFRFDPREARWHKVDSIGKLLEVPLALGHHQLHALSPDTGDFAIFESRRTTEAFILNPGFKKTEPTCEPVSLVVPTAMRDLDANDAKDSSASKSSKRKLSPSNAYDNAGCECSRSVASMSSPRSSSSVCDPVTAITDQMMRLSLKASVPTLESAHTPQATSKFAWKARRCRDVCRITPRSVCNRPRRQISRQDSVLLATDNSERFRLFTFGGFDHQTHMVSQNLHCFEFAKKSSSHAEKIGRRCEKYLDRVAEARNPAAAFHPGYFHPPGSWECKLSQAADPSARSSKTSRRKRRSSSQLGEKTPSSKRVLGKRTFSSPSASPSSADGVPSLSLPPRALKRHSETSGDSRRSVKRAIDSDEGAADASLVSDTFLSTASPGESPVKKRHSLRRHRENLEQMSSPVLKSDEQDRARSHASSPDLALGRLSLSSPPRSPSRSASLPDVLSPRSALAQRKARRKSAKESPASSSRRATILTRHSLKEAFTDGSEGDAPRRASFTFPLPSSLSPLDPSEIDFLRKSRSPRRALVFDDDSKGVSASSPSSSSLSSPSHKRHSSSSAVEEEVRLIPSRTSSKAARTLSLSEDRKGTDGFDVPPNPLRRKVTSDNPEAPSAKKRGSMPNINKGANDASNSSGARKTLKEVNSDAGGAGGGGGDSSSESPHVSKSQKVFRVSRSDSEGSDEKGDEWLPLASPPTPARHPTKKDSTKPVVDLRRPSPDKKTSSRRSQKKRQDDTPTVSQRSQKSAHDIFSTPPTQRSRRKHAKNDSSSVVKESPRAATVFQTVSHALASRTGLDVLRQKPQLRVKLSQTPVKSAARPHSSCFVQEVPRIAGKKLNFGVDMTMLADKDPIDRNQLAWQIIRKILIDGDVVMNYQQPQGDKKYGKFFMNAEEVLSICSDAISVFKNEESLLEMEAPIKVFGDIHGQLNDLISIFKAFGQPDHLIGDINVYKYLFLGDFVDRGKRSLEVIMLLYALKIQYPDRVFLIRGNHEHEQLNKTYGFFAECRERIESSQSEAVIAKLTESWSYLPIAALINGKILGVHGGIGRVETLDQIRALKRPIHMQSGSTETDNLILTDLLWSDPSESDDTRGIKENQRGVSVVFGPDRVEEFCGRNNIDLIVRAHQVVPEGYEYFALGHLITLFSATNYCGQMENNGAILVISADLVVTPKIVEAQAKSVALPPQNLWRTEDALQHSPMRGSYRHFDAFDQDKSPKAILNEDLVSALAKLDGAPSTAAGSDDEGKFMNM